MGKTPYEHRADKIQDWVKKEKELLFSKLIIKVALSCEQIEKLHSPLHSILLSCHHFLNESQVKIHEVSLSSAEASKHRVPIAYAFTRATKTSEQKEQSRKRRIGSYGKGHALAHQTIKDSLKQPKGDLKPHQIVFLCPSVPTEENSVTPSENRLFRIERITPQKVTFGEL